MTSSIWIGLCAALGALAVLLALALLVVLRRAATRGEARVGAVVRALEQRLDELSRELAGAVEQAEEEGRRSRLLAEIAGSLDLDDVLTRTLEGAVAVTAADAALVRLSARDGERPVAASLGVSADGAQEPAGPPDGACPAIVKVSYSYSEPAPGLIQRGLAVPLVGAAGAVGTLCVYTRDPRRRFDGEEGRCLAELAAGATAAIENARLLRAARRPAGVDALTGLHDRRSFDELLARECAGARRYGRRLALLLVDVDGFAAADDAPAEAARRIRSVVRASDVACRIDGDDLAVLLPEAGLEHAERLLRRLQGAVSARPVGADGHPRLSGGAAELEPGDDAASFFARADEALDRAKRRGQHAA